MAKGALENRLTHTFVDLLEADTGVPRDCLSICWRQTPGSLDLLEADTWVPRDCLSICWRQIPGSLETACRSAGGRHRGP